MACKFFGDTIIRTATYSLLIVEHIPTGDMPWLQNRKLTPGEALERNDRTAQNRRGEDEDQHQARVYCCKSYQGFQMSISENNVTTRDWIQKEMHMIYIIYIYIIIHNKSNSSPEMSLPDIAGQWQGWIHYPTGSDIADNTRLTSLQATSTLFYPRGDM